ncbi:MAG: hypothetical protein MUC48_10535 [Leptolyngbya sp. Prado105]|jgi:hypothetical protein|nr:hypothetical protein [Leptolyngbya sp. Prado105]
MTIDLNRSNSTENDQVRRNTPTSLNQRIDQAIATRIHDDATKPEAELSQRITQLDREWSTERVLELNASTLAFIGLILGITVHPNWFWLPGLVLPFLAEHAIQGWCPPLPIIRRLGVRTRKEIDREKFALKVLRGDFATVGTDTDANTRAAAALQAVER